MAKLALELETWAPNAFIPGTKYRLIRPLGAGGIGKVYEVENDRMRTRHALKAVNRDLAHRVDVAWRLRDEARELGSFDNDHIVKATETGVTKDGRLYYVMELLHGRSLRDELRRRHAALEGPAPDLLPWALGIMLQALTAIDAAHARGLMHRDLKPDNLFVTHDGLVKLLDFGVAKCINDDAPARPYETEPGSFVGTLLYAPPECLSGRDFDARSDLYSLGIVLWEMLAGAHPFNGMHRHQVVTNITFLGVPPLESKAVGTPFPAPLYALVRRATALDPAERFASAKAFGEAVLEVLALGLPASETLTLPAPREPSLSVFLRAAQGATKVALVPSVPPPVRPGPSLPPPAFGPDSSLPSPARDSNPSLLSPARDSSSSPAFDSGSWPPSSARDSSPSHLPPAFGPGSSLLPPAFGASPSASPFGSSGEVAEAPRAGVWATSAETEDRPPSAARLLQLRMVAWAERWHVLTTGTFALGFITAFLTGFILTDGFRKGPFRRHDNPEASEPAVAAAPASTVAAILAPSAAAPPAAPNAAVPAAAPSAAALAAAPSAAALAADSIAEAPPVGSAPLAALQVGSAPLAAPPVGSAPPAAPPVGSAPLAALPAIAPGTPTQAPTPNAPSTVALGPSAPKGASAVTPRGATPARAASAAESEPFDFDSPATRARTLSFGAPTVADAKATPAPPKQARPPAKAASPRPHTPRHNVKLEL